MTGRIIHLPGDGHREIQALLPWYLNQTLDPAEAGRVRAHLAQCAECQAELHDESRLAAEVAGGPLGAGMFDAEHGWKQISRQIELESRPNASPSEAPAPRRAPASGRRARFIGWRGSSAQPRRGETPWLRWAVAAQFGVIMVMGAAIARPPQPVRYHALGSAPAAASGNVVVIFRPETREKDLREILRANNARLVDGPTEADAYVLHVPTAGRAAVLARLRKQAMVLLAEPIDAG